MKYENFKQAEKIMSSIERHTALLDGLERSKMVVIRDKDEYDILTIVEGGDFEPFATTLIEDIKKDLQKRIDNLKSMLEQL